MKTVFKLRGAIDLAKAPYKTRQMAELLTFLKSVQGRHVTVSDICDYFQTKGIAVGTTTIYRHLEKMVQEGVVAKYVVDGNSSACFEYTGSRENETQAAARPAAGDAGHYPAVLGAARCTHRHAGRCIYSGQHDAAVPQ